MAKLIVTGTGKSGTHYAWQYFRALGMNMGHESVFSVYGVCPWGDYDGDCSFVAAAETQAIADDDYVLHVVRDPLKCVRTWMSNWHEDGGFWSLKSDHPVVGPFVSYYESKIPDVYRLDRPLDRCIRYVLTWNEMCEQIADQRVQVEHLDLPDLTAICNKFGLCSDVEPVIPHTQGSVDPRRFNKLGWTAIRSRPEGPALVAMAKRYGYKVGR